MNMDLLREEFTKNGLVVLSNIITKDLIDNHIKLLDEIRGIYDVRDENGFGERIGQLHQKCPELMDLVCSTSLLKFLNYVLQDEPVLFGSLNFEKGTQQSLHIDAIFFWPKPIYSMAGVWVALEDVDMDNGPLMYIPGSHKWDMIRAEEIIADNPIVMEERTKARQGLLNCTERGNFVSKMGKLWTEKFLKLAESKGAEIMKVPLRKGDVVVWHSLLAHGGDVINNKSRSRKSVVYHFLGKNAQLFSFENFMLLNKEEFVEKNKENINVANYKNIEFIKYPYFVTYNQGQQIVHDLTS